MDKSEVVYPVSEVFLSLQGEGTWTGSKMAFIRLAGCTVGKPYTPDAKTSLGLQVYQERCTDWAGSSFACDTDYRVHKRMTAAELVAMPEVSHATRVCLTGGEPLMHDLGPLLTELYKTGHKIHVETSGTIPLSLPSLFPLWMAVSPKLHVLPEMLNAACEIKVLVGDGFNEEEFVLRYMAYFHKLWVSPVNYEHTLNMDNVNRCVDLVKKYNEIRLCTQLHKIWGVR